MLFDRKGSRSRLPMLPVSAEGLVKPRPGNRLDGLARVIERDSATRTIALSSRLSAALADGSQFSYVFFSSRKLTTFGYKAPSASEALFTVLRGSRTDSR